MKSIIHVNQHHIRANAADGGSRPVYTIKQGRKTKYAREVIVTGPSKLVYDGRQLGCGARAWLETESPIVTIDTMTFEEARNAQLV